MPTRVERANWVRFETGRDLACRHQLGWCGNQSITIGRSSTAGGDGLGYSGGQVLVLALGACFYNNLYYAADQRNIKIRNVELEVVSKWTEKPVVSSGIQINAKVEAEATRAEIEDIILQASRESTVSNSVRQGAAVSMGDIQPVPVAPMSDQQRDGRSQSDSGENSGHQPARET